MARELLFSNPVFHDGLNVTVRNGDKWMKVSPGDSLDIKETGQDAVIRNGAVVGKALIPFGLVPENWLALEHDPSCHALAGLLAEMKRVYPGFNENSMVTVLIFRI